MDTNVSSPRRAASAATAAIAFAVTFFAIPPLAAQPVTPDAAAVARGRLLFLRCGSCHDADDRALPKTGPTLKGIVGRPSGAVPGYAYSPALKAHPVVWDAATLDRWLERPAQVVPETSMVFIGLPAAADRKALIAYLQTLQ